jgi:hypothetical protein
LEIFYSTPSIASYQGYNSMTSTFTTNLNLEEPGLGDYPNSWNVPLNSDITIIDQSLGTSTTQAFTNANVTLTVAQAAFFQIVCSGTLTGNVQLIFPGTIGGRRIIQNNCTGAFTLKALNGAGDAGGGIVIAQGYQTPILLTAGQAYYDQPTAIPPGSASIASATTTDLGSIPQGYLSVTGTTTITSFGSSAPVGQTKILTFAGVLTLTYNATSLILPSAANITTAAGDQAIVTQVSAGNWRAFFQRASGLPVVTPVVPVISVLPQGRLTLTTATPVMTSTVTAASSIIYTTYLGNQVPVWNGSLFTPTAFTETTQLLSDTTLSPAAAVANSLYDMFAWSNSGTIVCTRGPAWSNATTRSLALSRSNGVWVNGSSITNGPSSGFGVYVGTIATDAGGATCTWSRGGSASGGSAALLNVWNAFNRVIIDAIVIDNGTSYGGVTTTRQARGSSGNQVNFVSGLAEDAIWAHYAATMQMTDINGVTALIGIGLDSTASSTVSTQSIFNMNATGAFPTLSFPPACGPIVPQIGQHFLAALEGGSSSNNTNDIASNNTLSAMFRM